MLGQVLPARGEHAGDLRPVRGDGMAGGDQVRGAVGKRDRGAGRGLVHDHPARAEPSPRALRVRRPGLRDVLIAGQARAPAEHLPAAGVEVDRHLRAGHGAREQTRVAPLGTLLGGAAGEPVEAPAVHVGRRGLGDQVLGRTLPVGSLQPGPQRLPLRLRPGPGAAERDLGEVPALLRRERGDEPVRILLRHAVQGGAVGVERIDQHQAPVGPAHHVRRVRIQRTAPGQLRERRRMDPVHDRGELCEVAAPVAHPAEERLRLFLADGLQELHDQQVRASGEAAVQVQAGHGAGRGRLRVELRGERADGVEGADPGRHRAVRGGEREGPVAGAAGCPALAAQHPLHLAVVGLGADGVECGGEAHARGR